MFYETRLDGQAFFFLSAVIVQVVIINRREHWAVSRETAATLRIAPANQERPIWWAIPRYSPGSTCKVLVQPRGDQDTGCGTQLTGDHHPTITCFLKEKAHAERHKTKTIFLFVETKEGRLRWVDLPLLMRRKISSTLSYFLDVKEPRRQIHQPEQFFIASDLDDQEGTHRLLRSITFWYRECPETRIDTAHSFVETFGSGAGKSGMISTTRLVIWLGKTGSRPQEWAYRERWVSRPRQTGDMPCSSFLLTRWTTNQREQCGRRWKVKKDTVSRPCYCGGLFFPLSLICGRF